MKTINIILLATLLAIPLSTISAKKRATNINPNEEKIKQCLSTREYVTTLKFLRSRKSFSITELQARKIADRISGYCSGASKRFINVTALLVQAGLDSKNSIRTAEDFAKGTEEQSVAFINLFKQFFQKRYLDLDILSSVKMALSLSLYFKGNQKKAKDDFEAILKFCVSGDSLDLPKAKCANTAARITKLGEKFEKQIGEHFISLYRFATSKDGLELPTFKALELAEKTIKFGPVAKVNFIQAYKFATSEKGLKLTKMDAMKFAEKMATRSNK